MILKVYAISSITKQVYCSWLLTGHYQVAKVLTKKKTMYLYEPPSKLTLTSVEGYFGIWNEYCFISNL